MEIRGEIRGDLSVGKIKYYPSTQQKLGVIRISARMDRELTKKLLGGDFAKLVLPEDSGKRDEAGKYHHAYSSIKPTGAFDSHKMTILEKEINVTPELANVSAVENEEAIDIEFDLPVDVNKGMKSFWGEMAVSVGDTICVKFEPRQLSLPGTSTEDPVIKKVPGPHGSKVPKRVG